MTANGEWLTKWVDDFYALPTEKMDSNTSQFLHLLKVLESHGLAPDVVDPHWYNDTGPRMVRGWAKILKLDISDPATLALAWVCQSAGKVVMYAMALKHEQVNHEGHMCARITVARLLDLFPNGFPTRDSLSTAWTNQKDEKGLNRLESINPNTDFVLSEAKLEAFTKEEVKTNGITTD